MLFLFSMFSIIGDPCSHFSLMMTSANAVAHACFVCMRIFCGFFLFNFFMDCIYLWDIFVCLMFMYVNSDCVVAILYIKIWKCFFFVPCLVYALLRNSLLLCFKLLSFAQLKEPNNNNKTFI